MSILFALASAAFAMTCAEDLVVAVSAPIHPLDDRIVLEISYDQRTRLIEIPSFVRDLAATPGLKAIILAGNSGKDENGLEYIKTRHSLAYVFGEAFLDANRVQAHVGPEEHAYRVTETVRVPYDDGTDREWTAKFRTMFPFFRTQTGEVFFLPEENAIVIKAIGDYNETGDFAVPILDLLGVAPKDALLVHDDLELPQGELHIHPLRPGEYHGNNAILSMLRNLSYQTVTQVQPLLEKYVDHQQIETLTKMLRKQADGRATPMIENVDDLLKVYRRFVENDVFRARKAQIPEQLEMSRARQPMGQLIAESKRPETTPERKAEVRDELERIKASTAHLAAAIPQREDEIRADNERLLAEIREVLVARFSFGEFSIGTGDGTIPRGKGNGALKAEFVLSAYPQEVFGEDLWKIATTSVRQWLKAPPLIRGGARIGR